MKTNPDIVFNCKYIFNDSVKESASVNQIAFLTDVNKNGLHHIMKNCWYCSTIKQLINYYFNIIQCSPEFTFDAKTTKLANLKICIEKNIDLSPSVFAKMTENEHQVFKSYQFASKHKELSEFDRYIKNLKKQYGEPKQKKLIK